MKEAKHLAGRPFTGEACQHLAERLRGAYQRIAIDPQTSGLQELLERLDRLGAMKGELFGHVSSSHLDIEEVSNAVADAARLETILGIFELPSGRLAGVDRLKNKIRNVRLFSGSSIADSAWDHLAPLELAAMLCSRGASVEVEVDCPGGATDIVIRQLGHLSGIAIECKRPRTAATVPGAFRKALDQLSEWPSRGAVVLVLDVVDQPEGRNFIIGDTVADIAKHMDVAMESAVKQLNAESEIYAWMSRNRRVSNAEAVILWSTYHTLTKDSSGYGTLRAQSRSRLHWGRWPLISNSTDPWLGPYLVRHLGEPDKWRRHS